MVWYASGGTGTRITLLLHGLGATQGCQLSQDPRTFSVAGAPFGTLAASAQTRLLLARGEHDPMVSTAELRMHAEGAVDVPGTGHNAHVEDPGAIVGLLEGLLEHDREP